MPRRPSPSLRVAAEPAPSSLSIPLPTGTASSSSRITTRQRSNSPLPPRSTTTTTLRRSTRATSEQGSSASSAPTLRSRSSTPSNKSTTAKLKPPTATTKQVEKKASRAGTARGKGKEKAIEQDDDDDNDDEAVEEPDRDQDGVASEEEGERDDSGFQPGGGTSSNVIQVKIEEEGDPDELERIQKERASPPTTEPPPPSRDQPVTLGVSSSSETVRLVRAESVESELSDIPELEASATTTTEEAPIPLKAVVDNIDEDSPLSDLEDLEGEEKVGEEGGKPEPEVAAVRDPTLVQNEEPIEAVHEGEGNSVAEEGGVVEENGGGIGKSTQVSMGEEKDESATQESDDKAQEETLDEEKQGEGEVGQPENGSGDTVVQEDDGSGSVQGRESERLEQHEDGMDVDAKPEEVVGEKAPKTGEGEQSEDTFPDGEQQIGSSEMKIVEAEELLEEEASALELEGQPQVSTTESPAGLLGVQPDQEEPRNPESKLNDSESTVNDAETASPPPSAMLPSETTQEADSSSVPPPKETETAPTSPLDASHSSPSLAVEATSLDAVAPPESTVISPVPTSITISPPTAALLEVGPSPSPLSTLKKSPSLPPPTSTSDSPSHSQTEAARPSGPVSAATAIATTAETPTTTKNAPPSGMSIKPPQVRVQSMTPKDVRRRFNGHKITCVGMLNNELIKIAGELVLQKPIDMVEYSPLLERLQSNLKYLAAMAAQQQKKDNTRKAPEPPILNLPTTPLLSKRLNALYTSLKSYFYAAEKYEIQQAQLSGAATATGGGVDRKALNGAGGSEVGVNTLITTTVLGNPGVPATSQVEEPSGDSAKLVEVEKSRELEKGKRNEMEPIVTSKPESEPTAAPTPGTATIGTGISEVANGGTKRTREESEEEPSLRESESKKAKVNLPTVPEEEQARESSREQEVGRDRIEEDEEVVPANKIAQPTPTFLTTSIQAQLQKPPQPRMDVEVAAPSPATPQPRRPSVPSPRFHSSAVPSQPQSALSAQTSRTRPATPSSSLNPNSHSQAQSSNQLVQPPARPPSAQRNPAYGSALPAHLVPQPHAPSTPVSVNQAQPPNVNGAFAQLTPQQQNYIRQQQYRAMMAQQQAMNAPPNPTAPSPRMATNPNPVSIQPRPTSATSHSSPYAANAPSPAGSAHSATQPAAPSLPSSNPVPSNANGPLAEQYAGIQSIISAPTFRQLPPALQQSLQGQAQDLLYQMQAATLAMARNGGPPPPSSRQAPIQNRNVSPVHPYAGAAPSPRPRVPSYSQSPQVQNAQVPLQQQQQQQQQAARMTSVGPGGVGAQSQYAGSYAGSMAGSMAGSPPATATGQRPTSALGGGVGNYAHDSAALFREQLAQQNAIRSGSPAHGSSANYNQYGGHQRVASNPYTVQAPSPASQAFSHQSPASYAAPSPAAYTANHQQQQHNSVYQSAAASPAANSRQFYQNSAPSPAAAPPAPLPTTSNHHMQAMQQQARNVTMQAQRQASGSYPSNPPSDAPSPYYGGPSSQSVPPPRPPSQASYGQHQQPQYQQQSLAPPPVPQPKPSNPSQSTPVQHHYPNPNASPSPFLSNATNPASNLWTPTNVGTPSIGVNPGSSTDLWGNPASTSSSSMMMAGDGDSSFTMQSDKPSNAGGDDAWSEWLNL